MTAGRLDFVRRSGLVSVLVAELLWEPLRSGVVVGMVVSCFDLHYLGGVGCHGRREVIWAITVLGCSRECWECLALVACELHASVGRILAGIGSRIAGVFVEIEPRKF